MNGVKPVISISRNYPFKDNFTHVLGYVSQANEMDIEKNEIIKKNFVPGLKVGKIGLEKSRMAAYVVIMAALVCLYMPYWRGPFEFGQLVFQTPAILVLITLNGPLFKGEDALVSARIRVAMLLGLIGFLLPMLV